GIVVLGGDPLYSGSVALLSAVTTWLAYDVVSYSCRRYPTVRTIFQWAYTGRARKIFGRFGALMMLVQLWVTVSILPALLTCSASHWFSDYMQPWSLEQCLLASIGVEIFLSLVLDVPTGIVGMFNRVTFPSEHPMESARISKTDPQR